MAEGMSLMPGEDPVMRLITLVRLELPPCTPDTVFTSVRSGPYKLPRRGREPEPDPPSAPFRLAIRLCPLLSTERMSLSICETVILLPDASVF